METLVNSSRYVAELKQWEMLITSLQQENVGFRMQLAELVSSSSNQEVVLLAEKFNDEFAAQDGNLAFLADEVQRQGKELRSSGNVNDPGYEQWVSNQDKLRTSMGRLQEAFTNLRAAFARYLSGEQ